MKITHFIPEQLPEFIQSEYPVFVEFIQAYYKWYEEQYSIGKLEDAFDIDNTVDAFLKYFRSQLDIHGAFQSVDDKFLLRHIKDLYTSKGSAESFNFFFKTIYGKESSVFYPWDVTFKPSEGKWVQDTSVIVRVNAGSINTLLGNSVYMFNTAGQRYKTEVKSVTQRRGAVTPWVANAAVSIGNVFEYGGRVYEVVSGEDGEDLDNGLTINLGSEPPTHSSGTELNGEVFLKYAGTTDTNLYEIAIQRFSCGPYKFVRVESIDGAFLGSVVDTTLRAKVEKAGSGFEVGQIFHITSYGGSGTTIKVKSVDSNGGIKAVQIIGFGTGYIADFNVQITANTAQIPSTLKNKITINGLQYESGNAVNMQQESGVVIRHNYTNLAEKYVDPTYVGGIVGEFQTQNGVRYYESDYAQIKFTVGCIFQYPGYYASSDNIIGDQTFIEDSRYYQIYSYETAVEENIAKYGALLKATLHPTGTNHFGKYLIANQFTLAPIGEISLNVIQKPGGSIKDFVTTSDDILSINIDKYRTETLTAIDEGGIYNLGTDSSLLYVEILPTQYWIAGYLEGETPFTE